MNWDKTGILSVYFSVGSYFAWRLSNVPECFVVSCVGVVLVLTSLFKLNLDDKQS